MTINRLLLIDASCQGELSLILIEPGETLERARSWRYDAAELPTFTDALIRFERETGCSLRETEAALAVAGAVAGDTIFIARSRWVISRSGLNSLFGREIAILNDVAARAWATLTDVTVVRQLHGSDALALDVPGRVALVTLDDGVGAALINVDRAGRTAIVESEMGHTEFAAADAAEEEACRPSGRAGEQPSWEQALIAALAGGSAETAARLVGRFIGNTVLALGAWRGAMITGRNAALLTHPSIRLPFERGYLMRYGFRRQLGAASCWIVDQRDPVTAGLAAFLAAREANGRA